MTIIFFTTGTSASTSGVPFRTGGSGDSDELAADAVTGDFSGDFSGDEEAAADFTGDVTGDATGENFFGEVAFGKSANGEHAGEILGSGEIVGTGLGEGVLLVLFDCSATTDLGGLLGWLASAFEAEV